MRAELDELWKHRELLTILVRRDLKVRYKNSVLGFGWSVVNPLIQVAVLTVVLTFLMRAQDVKNYHAYVFCAMLPWLFFSVGAMDASPCLVKYRDVIKRTSFPRELIPLATVAANMIHFVLSTGVFVAYMAVGSLFFLVRDGVWDFAVQPTVVLLPIPMFGMLLLVVGISFFVSVWTLYFTDVFFLTDSLMKIIYWLAPVLYFPEIILEIVPGMRGELLYGLYMLNPLASFITAFRKLTLAPALMPGAENRTSPMSAEEWFYVGVGILISAAVARAGYHFYNQRKWKLAERA